GWLRCDLKGPLKDEFNKTPPAFRERRPLCQPNPVATALGSVSTSVSNPDAQAAAVVAIVVIVDGEYQTAIDGNGSVQVTADQVRLTELAICHANVGD